MPLRRVLAALALLAWSLVVVAAHAAGEAPAAPRRIVSLNLCTDQLVLALADRAAVRSVTWLARDPQNSVMAAAASEVLVNHGLAEEIIPFAPDLVVAGIYTARTTVALLKRFASQCWRSTCRNLFLPSPRRSGRWRTRSATRTG